MKYKVTINRREVKKHTFEVEAENRDEASEKALDDCCDFDFGESTIFYVEEEVSAIEEIV